MGHIVLFDETITRNNLLPLTYLRPVADIRLGILTIAEKWRQWMDKPVSYITQDYLSEKYPLEYGDDNFLINGAALPSPQLVKLLQQLEPMEALLDGEELIAMRISGAQLELLIHDDDEIDPIKPLDLKGTDFIRIKYPWDIFSNNAGALQLDFDLLTKGRTSAPLSDTNALRGPKDQLFIEKGAEVEHAIINVEQGPVYIGKGAKILEGCLIRGGLAMGESSILKMGTKLYGATTLGPGCKVGGEIKNVVFQANSNKGHDGYLGNAVIGEWCNLGAATNNSNLKNTYSEVKVWNYPEERFIKSGLQFCGLIMGDHSKCAIGTVFNTGTVVGISANVFGEGFPRNFVPSFSWGGKNGFKTYDPTTAFDTMTRVMERRKINFSVQDRLITLRVFEDTAKWRPWEKKG